MVILGHHWETWGDECDAGRGGDAEEAEEILLLHIGEGGEEILGGPL